MESPKIQVVNQDENQKIIEDHIKLLHSKSPGSTLQILEAGCGQAWWTNLNDIPYFLTGLDCDKDALEIRRSRHGDLDDMIVGDLRDADIPDSKFDVIYCAFVLEHIQESETVLKNFLRWLKPGGIAIVQIPDPDSVSGFITRITPHWFHVWVLKNLFGDPNAGKPGHGPYPTFYTNVLSQSGMYKFCELNGFTIIEEARTQRYYGLEVRRLIFTSITRLIGFLSIGLLHGEYDNSLYILEKS